MKRQFPILLMLLSSPLCSQGAEKRAFTIEDLYRVKSVSDIHVSPDGQSVVYALGVTDLPRAKRASHVWMVGIDFQNNRQITQSEKGESSPLFSPDGKWISFVSSRDGSANLYIMPANGGEGKQLTRISTGVSDPLWSPDGKSIAFSTDVYPECGSDDACNKKIADRWEKGPLRAHMADSLLYRHWTSWKDGTRTHVFLVAVATGESRDLTPGDFDSPPFQLGGPQQYAFAPDGSNFVYVSNHDKEQASSTNSDLWLISLADKSPAPRNLTASNPAYDGSPKYSPDGRYIAYRMQKTPGCESDLFRIAVYDATAGTSSVLTESFRNWIDDFEWSRDSKAIYFTGPGEGENPIYRIDIGSRKITQLLRDKTIDAFAFTPDEKQLVYVKRSVGEPTEIHRADIAAERVSNPTRLTSANRELIEVLLLLRVPGRRFHAGQPGGCRSARAARQTTAPSAERSGSRAARPHLRGTPAGRARQDLPWPAIRRCSGKSGARPQQTGFRGPQTGRTVPPRRAAERGTVLVSPARTRPAGPASGRIPYRAPPFPIHKQKRSPVPARQ